MSLTIDELLEDIRQIPDSSADAEERRRLTMMFHIGDGIHKLAEAVDRLGFNILGTTVEPAHGVGERLVMELREIPWETFGPGDREGGRSK